MPSIRRSVSVWGTAYAISAEQSLGRQGCTLKRFTFVDYLLLFLDFSPQLLIEIKELLNFAIEDTSVFSCILFVTFAFQLFHYRTHI